MAAHRTFPPCPSRTARGTNSGAVVVAGGSFARTTTKNRPLGPPWLGILIPNEFDRECCALTAVRQYARCLLKFGGHLHANAPFFQRFDSNRHCFTGQALTVADLDQACRKKTGSRAGYLRMEGANLMIAAGLRPDYQEIGVCNRSEADTSACLTLYSVLYNPSRNQHDFGRLPSRLYSISGQEEEGKCIILNLLLL